MVKGKAFWDKKNPNKTSTKLTSAQKAAAKARARGGHVTSAATAQKQATRRGKCLGDVPVVPITRYFAASPAASTAR